MDPKSWFPLSVLCKKQTSNSNGTTEAEIVAISHILRQEAIPIQQLWELLLNRKVAMEVYEDNAGSILVVENGYSPSLRHLVKTQKCSIDLLHDIMHSIKLATLVKVDTGDQVGDVFTKSFNGPAWDHALSLLNVQRGGKVSSGQRTK